MRAWLQSLSVTATGAGSQARADTIRLAMAPCLLKIAGLAGASRHSLPGKLLQQTQQEPRSIHSRAQGATSLAVAARQRTAVLPQALQGLWRLVPVSLAQQPLHQPARACSCCQAAFDVVQDSRGGGCTLSCPGLLCRAGEIKCRATASRQTPG